MKIKIKMSQKILKNNSQGGYVMLLLLMIGLVLIVIFIVRTDLFTGGDKSVIEKGVDAIEEAKKAKTTLENNYKFDPEGEEQGIDDSN